MYDVPVSTPIHRCFTYILYSVEYLSLGVHLHLHLHFRDLGYTNNNNKVLLNFQRHLLRNSATPCYDYDMPINFNFNGYLYRRPAA